MKYVALKNPEKVLTKIREARLEYLYEDTTLRRITLHTPDGVFQFGSDYSSIGVRQLEVPKTYRVTGSLDGLLFDQTYDNAEDAQAAEEKLAKLGAEDVKVAEDGKALAKEDADIPF